MLLKKTQLASSQEINFSISEASQYCHIYSDFLFGTSSFQVYLNNSLNTTLGGGVDAGGHPGQVILTTATTNSGQGHIGNAGNLFLKLSGGIYKYETCIQLPIIGSSAQEYEVNFGLLNLSKDATQSVQFYYDNVINSNNWQVRVRNNINSVFINIDTNVAIVANSWYKLTIISHPLKVFYYINGQEVAVINTSTLQLTDYLAPILSICKWVGTTARIMNVDYLEFIHKLIR